jgi:predicted transcriptional regulator
MVTDRSAPMASVTAQVPRATYNIFAQIAEARRITKSELARELIEQFVTHMAHETKGP